MNAPLDDVPGLSAAEHLDADEARLTAALEALGPPVVCLSGGVDSSLLAALAHQLYGEGMLAVTGVSASLSSDELSDIARFCEGRGIPHATVTTHELSIPGYVENSPDRCYHCKSELYDRVLELAAARGFSAIVDGTHAEDLRGHRPGHRAATERTVRSPLAELGLTKATVRALAQRHGLENADRPSAPCLSSRIAYGVEVTEGRLQRVADAEEALRALGFTHLRVRLHDAIARIEIPRRQLVEAVARADEVVAAVKAAGFTYVTLDLQGLRSGSLLEVLPGRSSS